jgi:hypothetical protein
VDPPLWSSAAMKPPLPHICCIIPSSATPFIPTESKRPLQRAPLKEQKFFASFFQKIRPYFLKKKKQKLLLFWIRAKVAASGGLRGADLIL